MRTRTGVTRGATSMVRWKIEAEGVAAAAKAIRRRHSKRVWPRGAKAPPAVTSKRSFEECPFVLETRYKVKLNM